MSVTVRRLTPHRPYKQRGPDFVWDDDDGEFVDSEGEPVDRKKLLLLVLLLMQFGRASARAISESLIAEEITIEEWYVGMSTMISSMIISEGVLAYGGADNLTPERMVEIETLITEQQALLDNFKAQIVSGDVAIGPGLVSRSELYSLPGWPAYAKLERQRKIADGAQWERRVLDSPVNGCSECEEEADRGWEPAGTLPDIGSLFCSVGCKCSLIYSDSAAKPSDSEDDG